MAASVDDESDQLEEDYYTFLNLSVNASQEEITNAYRRLSRIYHPDKHADPIRKKEAEILFNKTKKAYEVLRDPHKRAIYDNLGTKGLETEGWEIVQRTKTPEEIREEYERLAREREERRLQQRTNPRGTVTVSINASDIFNPYDEEYYEYRNSWLPIIEVKGMSFSQSIEAPLTMKDTALMSGSLSTHNGTGSGSVNMSVRRVTSAQGWAELDVGFGSGLSLSAKGFRTLTKRLFTNVSGVITLTDRGLRPGFVGSVGYQMNKSTMGYLSYKAGGQSSMSTTLVCDSPRSNVQTSLVLGIPHSYFSLTYVHKFEKHEGRLRGSIKAGTFGAIVEYGIERKVSQHSSMGASMAVGVPTGVTLKIKLVRGNQTYAFPILLCDEVLPSPIFYGTIAPLVAWVVIRRLVVEPYLQQQKQKDLERHREMHRTQMLARRREAEAAVDLMRETYRRIVEDEENRRGLIITKGIYGRWLELGSRNSGDAIVDVTIPLQCLVKDSKLILHEPSKSQLPGFYDPCIGEDKCLHVEYTFHGSPHIVTIQDNEPLRIPKQSHRKQTN